MNQLANSRILEMDVLRGFAVLGIFLVNITFFGYPYEAHNFPILIGQADELNTITWLISNLLVNGSMFALFSMLYGASALIILNETKIQGSEGIRIVDFYYRRTFWLIGFGLIHAYLLLWPLEILFTLGILGLLLFPLRNLSPLLLLSLGVVLCFTGTINTDQSDMLAEYQEVLKSESMKYQAAAANDDTFVKQEFIDANAEDILATTNLYLSDYQTIRKENLETVETQQTTNLYQDNIYDAGGVMLIGMAFMKWGILSGMRTTSFYLLMVVIGYTTALWLRWSPTFGTAFGHFDPFMSIGFSEMPFMMARIPLAVGHFGLIMLLCRSRWFRAITKPLAAAGRMALTNYVGQTLFSIFLFYGFGLAMFGKLEYYQLTFIAIGFGLTQVILSTLWLGYFRYGPLEWLWRSLSKAQMQPIRKTLPVKAEEKVSTINLAHQTIGGSEAS
jgi:uncharacterized protein